MKASEYLVDIRSITVIVLSYSFKSIDSPILVLTSTLRTRMTVESSQTLDRMMESQTHKTQSVKTCMLSPTNLTLLRMRMKSLKKLHPPRFVKNMNNRVRLNLPLTLCH